MKLSKGLALGGLALLTIASGLITTAYADQFPLTIKNCGSEITIKAAPKRIVLVNNSVLGQLTALNAVDLLVGRTQDPVEGIYPEAAIEKFMKVPLLSKTITNTGGSVISLETILAQKPDLVLAPQSALDRELLAKSGVPMYAPPAYCENKDQAHSSRATFDLVYDDLLEMGTIIGKPDLAKQRVTELKELVASLKPEKPGVNGTAVALYASAGGKVLYPYGARSMVTPLFEAAGFTNVYADTDERVFEGSIEDLIAKDPQTILMLYSFGDPADATKTLTMIPALQGLSAVRNKKVLAFPFPYTDPPTPLSIVGVSVLLEKLKELK
nr:ABC transporter substrate-binding protein [uncultured Cohaesibacter sp.]